MRRLFFALWPDAEQRSALERAAREAVRTCGGRPTPGASLHLTLAFLGAVPEARSQELSGIARCLAAGFSPEAAPLELTLDRLAHWPKPGVLAVLAHEETRSAALLDARALAEKLTSETIAAGFGPDLKPFCAHVTVARKVARAPRSLEIGTVRWTFDAFALLESRTLAEGPVYSIVESFVLGGAGKVRT